MKRQYMKMPFGKYRGCYLDELPDDYLAWLQTIDLHGTLRPAVDDEVEHRRGQEPEAMSHEAPPEVVEAAKKIVAAGFKRASTQAHPDHGGQHEEMIAINAANTLLKTWLSSGRAQ